MGYDADHCLIDFGETAEAVVSAQLQGRQYDCIMIGAGVRTVTSNFILFEKLINIVHEHAPDSKICFNTKPRIHLRHCSAGCDGFEKVFCLGFIGACNTGKAGKNVAMKHLTPNKNVAMKHLTPNTRAVARTDCEGSGTDFKSFTDHK